MRYPFYRLICVLSLVGGMGMEVAAQSDTVANADDEKEVATESENEASPQAGATFRAFGRIIGAILGGPPSGADEEEESELLGQPAPDFELNSIDGSLLRLKDLRGEVVVLDFWATWCGPCMRAMPEVQKVHDKFSGKKVRIIGVNQGEALEDVENMLEEKKFTFTQVLDTDSKVGDSFGVSGIPQTVVIDADGTVQSVHVGYSPTLEATLSSQIEKLLSGEQLFDPEKVAAVRKRREERQAEAAKQLDLKNEERLVRLGNVLEQSGATLSDSFNHTQWNDIPGETMPALIAVVGERRVATIRPNDPKATVIDMKLPDSTSIWSCVPATSGDALRFAVVTAEYDDNYDAKLSVAMCDKSGDVLWTKELPTFKNDYQPGVFTASADLVGDEKPEVAVVTQLDALSELRLTGPGDSTRVLTVFNFDGEMLLRAFIPGQGGVGMYVVPDKEGNALLLTTDEGLTKFRVRDGKE